ncbi:MAG: PHP domain-containing protein [Anaerolineae bacterium]
MTGPIKVDLHLHTCASKDCATRPADVIQAARRRGLQRIAITDHNSIAGALAAQALDPDFVIAGEEILTTHGELLAYFVTEYVPPHLSPDETLDRLAGQGAVVSVSHPFDPHRNGGWREEALLQIVDRLDAIEVFNARCFRPQDNERALAFARAHGLPGTAGSDAHSALEIGRGYVTLPPFATAQEFRAALPAAEAHGQLSSPWVHLISRFNVFRLRLGLKPTIRHR